MLILGSVLVAGAILVTALVALLFRRPDPPRWTTPDLVAMLVAVPIAGVMALGLGYLLAGVHQLRSTVDLFEIAATVGVWIGAVVLWRLLDVRARLRAYAAIAARGVASQPSMTGALPAAGQAQPPEFTHRNAA